MIKPSLKNIMSNKLLIFKFQKNLSCISADIVQNVKSWKCLVTFVYVCFTVHLFDFFFFLLYYILPIETNFEFAVKVYKTILHFQNSYYIVFDFLKGYLKIFSFRSIYGVIFSGQWIRKTHCLFSYIKLSMIKSCLLHPKTGKYHSLNLTLIRFS